MKDVIDALQAELRVLIEDIGLPEVDLAADLFDVAKVAGRQIIKTADGGSF